LLFHRHTRWQSEEDVEFIPLRQNAKRRLWSDRRAIGKVRRTFRQERLPNGFDLAGPGRLHESSNNAASASHVYRAAYDVALDRRRHATTAIRTVHGPLLQTKETDRNNPIESDILQVQVQDFATGAVERAEPAFAKGGSYLAADQSSHPILQFPG
jgi:hypothetical protein